MNKNELMTKMDKHVYRVLNYIEHLLILISTVRGCLLISAFASLVGILIGIASSAAGLTARTNKYKSIIKKKKKKQDIIFTKI